MCYSFKNAKNDTICNIKKEIIANEVRTETYKS